MAVPTKPVLFAKFPNTLIGHGASIVYPRVTTQLDYEGARHHRRRASGVTVDDALGYVGAYTILDDVSARDLQSAEAQWIRGRASTRSRRSGHMPSSRTMASTPRRSGSATTVSGELRQDSACQGFLVAEIISFVSEAITLEPGDIISTGTPPGVGLGFDPPRELLLGDTVSIEIEGIGVLSNQVVVAA